MEAISRGELDKLVLNTDNMEIIDDDALASPPEAMAEAEPGSTIYVRVPSSLKKRVDDAARDKKLSRERLHASLRRKLPEGGRSDGPSGNGRGL